MKKNILQIKSFEFAKKIVNLYKDLIAQNQYDLARQVLRSGTSVGANIEEAIGGFTEKEFASKLSIAYKESRETIFWIKLLYSTKYIPKEIATDLLSDLNEICRIIAKTISTIKNKQKIQR